MTNDDIIKKERRDYSEFREIMNDAIKPIINDLTFVKKKLNSKVETVIRNEERIMSLENKNKDEKTGTRFGWTTALSIIACLISFSGTAVAIFILIQRGLDG